MNQFSSALWLVVIIFLTGCGGDGKYPVRGTVTWEGDPIPIDHNGYVTLTPVDSSTPPDAGPIINSEFNFRCTPGEKKVEILITRPHGKMVESMGAAPHEQYIPVRYNEETELTTTVETKSNAFTFDLVPQKGDRVTK